MHAKTNELSFHIKVSMNEIGSRQYYMHLCVLKTMVLKLELFQLINNHSNSNLLCIYIITPFQTRNVFIYFCLNLINFCRFFLQHDKLLQLRRIINCYWLCAAGLACMVFQSLDRNLSFKLR